MRMDDLHPELESGLRQLGLEVALAEPLLAYLALLARWNATYNLTAIRDPREMVTRHLLDSLAMAEHVSSGSLADLGTGPGLPGIPLAIATPALQVTLVDLPQQLALAQVNIEAAGLSERVRGHAADLLSAETLPGEADVWWMSQFLDCFSPMEILSILRRVRAAMPADASVYLLEMFWDVQQFEAAAYSLNASSLYFTCLANGNSRFYPSADLLHCLEQAGLRLEQQLDNVGVQGHTLLLATPA